MRLSHGTGSQLDFRKKKRGRGRWFFRAAIALLLVVIAVVRIVPMLEARKPLLPAQVAQPQAPRVIEMN